MNSENTILAIKKLNVILFERINHIYTIINLESLRMQQKISWWTDVEVNGTIQWWKLEAVHTNMYYLLEPRMMSKSNYSQTFNYIASLQPFILIPSWNPRSKYHNISIFLGKQLSCVVCVIQWFQVNICPENSSTILFSLTHQTDNRFEQIHELILINEHS